MPSSLYCSGMIPNGLHGRRMCIQQQVLCGLLYHALGSWRTASRRTLVMSSVVFLFICPPALIFFIRHGTCHDDWPLLVWSRRAVVAYCGNILFSHSGPCPSHALLQEALVRILPE